MNNLQPSQWLWSFLEAREVLRLTAYKPTPHDVWTLGYGHTRGVKEGDTCSTAQAIALLHGDVAGSVNCVQVSVRVPLTQNQFDALVSLVFNCGPAPLNRTLGSMLNAGNYKGAAAEFPKWDRQAGEVLQGLLTRREAEEQHFLA